jgi:hypothetical protein
MRVFDDRVSHWKPFVLHLPVLFRYWHAKCMDMEAGPDYFVPDSRQNSGGQQQCGKA